MIKLPVGWIVAGVALVLMLCYGGCACAYRQDCVRAEAGIKAQYKQGQNYYDNMWKKFKEMAQVPEMYTADLQKVYDGAIKARYGADGSKAVFQFISEHNPNFDASMYTKLQAAVEAGRNGFTAEQQSLLDKKREYEVVLNSNRGALVGFWFGFPKINLSEYDIVTSELTEETFKSKKADEFQLRTK